MIAVRQYASQGFLKASSSSSRGQRSERKTLQWACCSDQNHPSTVQPPRCGMCRTFPQGSGPRRSRTFVHLQGKRVQKQNEDEGCIGCAQCSMTRRQVHPTRSDCHCNCLSSSTHPWCIACRTTRDQNEGGGGSAPAIRPFGFRITLTSPLGAVDPI